MYTVDGATPINAFSQAEDVAFGVANQVGPVCDDGFNVVRIKLAHMMYRA